PGGGGRVLVTFDAAARAGTVRAAHRAVGRALGRAAVSRHLEPIAVDVVAVDDMGAAVEAYRRQPGVVAAEADGPVRALGAPADNLYGAQWNLQPPTAANRGTLNWEPVYPAAQGAGVLVAVVDTGIRLGGPDGFEPGAVRTDLDYDFVNDDPEADDENGHGTHVAGTIAQRTGNPPALSAPSLAGVAPKASILPIKVLDRFGEGTISDTVTGILYAAAQGARVINLSLGGDYTRAMCTAVASVSGSALVVAASGNEAEDGVAPVAWPGACPRALAVGGLRYDGTRAGYSNPGCELAATAPGGDLTPSGRQFPSGFQEDPRNGIIQETWVPERGAFLLVIDSGTSMAAAHAAGAAAVLLGVQPDVEVVRRALLGSARDLGPPGQDDEYGSGALDLGAALAAVQNGTAAPPPDALGYWMVASDGGIFAFGQSPFLGSTGGLRLNSPIVAMARTPTGRGYWLVAADGGVFNFGDAQFFGSAGGLRLKAPVVGMAATGTGRGYWLVAGDGGIFSFGDAPFLGSTGALRLNRPIVGMATDRTSAGYWLVASDGGIFTFGDAPFRGSTGNLALNAPIVALAPTPTGDGYWLVATDGGIFAFGDAGFFGSTGALRLNSPVVGMTPTCYGTGYWLVAADGGVFSFGGAEFRGSTGDLRLNRPVVGMQLGIDHRYAQN
ncbi:MAG TPA: S8 family serine peptidase, partial [Acidimicrobiales bacterium]|nr:S8 family serine peptidase [Acidimicrobiales bacterium]